MDGLSHWPSRSAGHAARRHHIKEQWADTRQELTQMEQAARFYLMAVKARRDRTYDAELVKEIDNHAADFAGRVLDLLSTLHGAELIEADEAGVHADDLAFDVSILHDEYETWNERAGARR